MMIDSPVIVSQAGKRADLENAVIEIVQRAPRGTSC
jgi:hypothetical protein